MIRNSLSSSIIERASGWVAVLAILALPVVLYGAVNALGVFSNDIKQWLPGGFDESVKYEWFVKSFGLDEMAVVSWEGCTVDDPRLEKLARDLKQVQLADGTKVFEKVVTGPEIMDRVRLLGWTEDQTLDRTEGIFVGEDGRTTCLIATPNAALVKNRTVVVDKLVEAATATTGLEASMLHLGGPTVDGAAIDRESKLALRQFLWVTLLVVFGLTWFRKRSFRLSVIIMTIAGYCAALSLAILYYSGGTMNLTMIMLPTLVLILAVSAAIHMVNYFLKAFAKGGAIDENTGMSAGLRAIRTGGFPVLLASLTTAVGMASLATSQIAPIRWFGLYSAVGVLASLPVVVLALMWVLNRSTRWLAPRHYDNLTDDSSEPTPGFLVSRIAGISLRYRSLIVAGCLLAIMVVGWGITELKATVKVQNRFATGTKLIQDYLWLESRLGPLVPMEVVIRIPESHPLDEWKRMQAVEWLEKAIRKNADINASMSAATFRPPVRKSTGIVDSVTNRMTHESFARRIEQLSDANLVAVEGNDQLWRISLRIAAMNDIDYGILLDDVKKTLDKSLKGLNETLAKRQSEAGLPAPPELTTVVTGAIPMMYKAQRQVFSDLTSSFLSAFVLIALTMMVVLRSIAAGLIAMLPNIFPPLIVLGYMGWTGNKIEIGSVMTASVALGISVDDTIHFLTWYRRGLIQTGSVTDAIQKAYAYCSRSMVDTTLICGLGVAPFMFSSFMPTVQFARLMLLLLVIALIGDLIFLPAILASPLGRFFRGDRRNRTGIHDGGRGRWGRPQVSSKPVSDAERQNSPGGDASRQKSIPQSHFVRSDNRHSTRPQ